MSEQLLKTERKTFDVEGKGDKYVAAVGELFTHLRSAVFDYLDEKPLVNMKAEEVSYTDVKVKEWTEHFLFIFWPRKRKEFDIKAKITVVIDYIDKKEEELSC